MKKMLLTFALALAGFTANSQVIFSVEEPASIAGGYDLTYAKSSGDWGTPDMLVPANSVTGLVKIARDGTAPDSLMCGSATAGSLSGYVAMLYRGTCEFGSKARNAFNAGAIAIIVVNNDDTAPFEMSGGSETPIQGMSVTVPVVMISKATGALINARIKAGDDVEVFIGNKVGYYPNDLGIAAESILTAPSQAIPAALAANTTEFPVKLGAWVYNYGSNDQATVTLTAEIMRGATSVYSETSTAVAIDAGDSAWVALPDYVNTSLTAGKYVITYTTTSGGTDDYPRDNTVVTEFNVTADLFSLARLGAGGRPFNSGGIKPASPQGSFTSCINFRDSHASRLGATGVYFSAAKASSSTEEMTGEEITVQAYKWKDVFTDLNGTPAITDLEEVGSASYVYASNLKDTTLYVPFSIPFAFQDNQRYLVCVRSTNQDLYLGYDSQTKYDQITELYLQPLYPIQDGSQWYLSGFTGGVVPTIGIKTVPVASLGIAENTLVETTVYPNPAKDAVNINIKGYAGDAVVTVTDIAGKIVMNSTITVDAVGSFKVNTAELTNGMYIFNLTLNNGSASKVNVVINK